MVSIRGRLLFFDNMTYKVTKLQPFETKSR